MPHALLVFVLALAQEAKPEALAYPTFEPFTASRMFAAMGDSKTADLGELVRQLGALSAGLEAGKEAGEEFSPAKTSSASASLEPRVPSGERMVASLIPVVLIRLEPLWSTAKWSAEQVADARAACEILAKVKGAPQPTFAEGKDAENKSGLEEIVKWFRGLVAKPEWYAAMYFTMDDGPFVGLPYEVAVPLPPQAVQKLDDKTELRLCRVKRKNEPWVLQVVREGKLSWSRVVSGAPDESVAGMEFLPEGTVLRLGNYGWRVRMLADWSQGKELCEVFLDPQGKLLFYFLSW